MTAASEATARLAELVEQWTGNATHVVTLSSKRLEVQSGPPGGTDRHDRELREPDKRDLLGELVKGRPASRRSKPYRPSTAG